VVAWWAVVLAVATVAGICGMVSGLVIFLVLLGRHHVERFLDGEPSRI
jgi:hypothetical protein